MFEEYKMSDGIRSTKMVEDSHVLEMLCTLVKWQESETR